MSDRAFSKLGRRDSLCRTLNGIPPGKEICDMSFNFELFKEIRLGNSMSRAELADLLGVSESHVYKLERGLKQPSPELARKISAITGIAPGVLMSGENGGETVPRIGVEIKDRLEHECRARRKAEKLNNKKDRIIERLENVIKLHVKFADIILCGQSPDKGEIRDKVEELAKEAANEGKVTFNDIWLALRVGRMTLRNLLWGKKRVFRCEFTESGQIIAKNPCEAGLRLRCFDCAAFESGKCAGYGDETRPGNIIELIDRLVVNGVTRRTEQSKILDSSYDIALSPHEISEVIYKHKHGLHIPEGLFYMEMTRRKK
jgi:transcriptional regulator with XRE-family HTH domain